jgi:outer membrane protein assembly factor BamB
LLLLAGCPRPAQPRQSIGAVTLEIGRDGASLRGVAAGAGGTYAALTAGDQTSIEMHAADGRLAWHAELAGQAGPIASDGTTVFVALGAHLRGDPGALVVAIGASGAEAWRREIDASEWSVISAIAPIDSGVVVGGSFSGTLRAGDKVVSSAGKADGFVARIAKTGEVAWLERVGGVNVDGVTGVAARGERIAIAGSIGAGADLLGAPLPPYTDQTPRSDGFVAELDGKGARVWSTTFGGKLDDTVAGVAIDAAGRVAVAANVREVFKIGTTELIARGDGDGCVAWWNKDGSPAAPAIQLGGADFDGVRAIVAVEDRVVVAGFFSGTIKLGAQSLTAGGGDDAFVAALSPKGIAHVWPVTGEGREEVTALAPAPHAFVAGVTHTARARVDGAELPAPPKDPLGGAALIVRPLP